MLTIEKMYELKEQYVKELRSIEAKIEVISDLIEIAKEEPETEEPVVEATVEEVAPVTNYTDGNLW